MVISAFHEIASAEGNEQLWEHMGKPIGGSPSFFEDAITICQLQTHQRKAAELGRLTKELLSESCNTLDGIKPRESVGELITSRKFSYADNKHITEEALDKYGDFVTRQKSNCVGMCNGWFGCAGGDYAYAPYGHYTSKPPGSEWTVVPRNGGGDGGYYGFYPDSEDMPEAPWRTGAGRFRVLAANKRNDEVCVPYHSRKTLLTTLALR